MSSSTKYSPFLSQVQFQRMTLCIASRTLRKVQNTEQVTFSQEECETHGSVNFEGPSPLPAPITRPGK